MKNYIDSPNPIQLNPDHKGKFTEWAKRHGFKSVQAAAAHVLANKDRYPVEVVRMANFAHNAKKWGHSVPKRSDAMDTGDDGMGGRSEDEKDEDE